MTTFMEIFEEVQTATRGFTSHMLIMFWNTSLVDSKKCPGVGLPVGFSVSGKIFLMVCGTGDSNLNLRIMSEPKL